MEIGFLEEVKSVDINENLLKKLFEACKEEIEEALSNNKSSIIVSYGKILSVLGKDLASELLDNPDTYLEKISGYFTDRLSLGRKFRVRIKDLPETRFIRIRDIRSEHTGKLIETEGIIKISSEVRPVVVKVKYRHEDCGGEEWYEVKDFKIETPKKCKVCRRAGGKFIEVEREVIDVQRLLVEETPEQIEKGEQPANILVILKEDLCEPKMERKTLPGVRIKLTGIVRTYQKSKSQALMEIYIDAVNLEISEKDFEDEFEISEEDEAKILEIAKSGNALELIAKSIAPNLYGKQYDIIKQAIALQLVSGKRKRIMKGYEERRNIHILLIGDPGVGKSQILKYVAEIAPKARYVVAASSSAVGLTASVRKDDVLKGGWVLEAGALVLASGGIVCIDELDKISDDDLLLLHEAMEQQTITINKANIHATLRAETSILAAANPKFGRWDKMKSIIDQIDLPPTILNRFDLIFVLKDTPDEEIDRYIADEVLNALTTPPQPPLSEDLLKKYIIYARRLDVEWTDKAKEELKRFYLDLRKKTQEVSAMLITTRQLQSLIRLAEASAKIRLSKIVTEEDVMLAEKLFLYMLKNVGINPETMRPDIDQILTGISSTERKRLSSILDIIKELAKSFPNGVPLSEIIERGKKEGFDEEKIRSTIEKLLREGYIYERGPNMFLPT